MLRMRRSGALLFSVAFLAAFVVNAQVEENEIPADLQYLFKSDFDKYEPSKDLLKNFTFYLSGYDEDNRPVWIVEFGRWKIKEAILRDEEGFEKYVDWAIYNMIQSIGDKATEDAPVKDIILIVDADGFEFEQLNSPRVVPFVVRVVRKLLNQAIKMAETAYVINANYVMEVLLNLVRPLFGSEFNRIDIYGPNAAKWRPVLLKNIPREALPEWYGGVKNFKPVRVYG